MKKNKKMKRINLFCLFFIFISTTFFSQYIDDSKVKVYKKDIIKFLIQKKEFSSTTDIVDIPNMIYIREIYSNPKNISIYQISTTSAHSFKYFSIVKGKNIFLFNSIDLNEDFDLIINKLENTDLSKRELFKILKEGSLIYDYNRKIKQNKEDI
ncbi:hypothetical protein N0B16_05615 [Chryseobacterium sp. GMJ5]|uniref:Uncharacterized protein n=1 Tax=Chryseobacterium gilvum TaxID=2976534 RepID=A0ABT2VXU0_9FLAO|nr:hypothetical protein [Chryseobacterium gilvum]MCU7613909.1 hypothetical protein [Chryseobacterium gilvum]